jgi:predicted DNA-binding transcriptional regulator AlpA
MVERKAYTVDEFANAHGISRSMLYMLWNQNIGPRYMKIGSRRIISEESAHDWRQSREQASIVAA